MTQRAYIIVLEDDPDDPGFDWFEKCVKESALDTWDNCGYSAMDFVNLTVPAEDAEETDPNDDYSYPEEGSDRDDGDIMQDLADTCDLLRGKIQRDKAE